MFQSPRSGKNRQEKRRHKRNILNHNKLQTSLIFRVFATNFALGGLHVSYERHFVKKIQHLFSFHAAFHQTYRWCFPDAFICRKIILKWKRCDYSIPLAFFHLRTETISNRGVSEMNERLIFLLFLEASTNMLIQQKVKAHQIEWIWWAFTKNVVPTWTRDNTFLRLVL